MESPLALLLISLVANFAIFHLVQAQDQEGFISLDCGLPPNEPSSYIEPVTKLRYQSDSNFIQSGKIGRTNTSLQTNFYKQHTTMRYFPEGIRNCYNLTVKKGTNYFIRARFIYGNYDGLNIYPKFDIYLGPNFWVTIDLEASEDDVGEEILHTPLSNFLDVCLVKTNSSLIPFISALDLRPLPNNSYITTGGSLRTLLRWFYSTSDTFMRYPKDVCDRSWQPYLNSDWKMISTSLTANNSNDFDLPQEVLTTAAIPVNSSALLANYKFPGSSQDRVFMFLHFSEVQLLPANETREFKIRINGVTIMDSFSPGYLQPETVYNGLPVICNINDLGLCTIELTKSAKSTHPPMLNAMEAFLVADFQQSDTYENDVLAIKKIKTAYELHRISWQGDPCVPRQYLWDGLDCTDTDKQTAPRITSLNLSSSGLTGTIAAEIQNLTNLEKLDLSNNKLVGGVPEFLANMKSLMFINLSNNDMNGSIPQALRDREKKGLKLFVDEHENSPCLSGSCDKKFPVMIVALVASAVVVVLVALALFCVFRKKKTLIHVEAKTSSLTAPKNLRDSNISDEVSIETKRKKYTYSEVMQMTNNFQRALGEGGFGTVYHGDLDGSQQVAVKLLSPTSTQGYKEFKAEVELLLRVHHINLVNLVGYCDEREHLALIYEYMSNVDLKYHLSGKHGGNILSWNTRLRIVVDAALGLEYLHIGCRPSMVHRDVKSTNILLDEKFTAKIADFGLSRSFQLGDNSHIVSTAIAGTPGYLDPEYYRTGRLAEMSDVYSFGIVLLEIITNQRVIDQTREKSHIPEWTAFMLNRGDITRIMDPSLNGDYNSRSVWRALELAMMCTNPSSEQRPSMSRVVFELKECLNSENSVQGKNPDIDSQSLLEPSMSFDTKDVPSAR